MPTAHLHVHSSYSFGVGTASPEALCLAAARQGVDALALTDLGGLYGIPDFLAAAHRHGIHPVVGASLPDPTVPRSVNSGRALVLARDPQGWKEIARLLSARHASPRAPLTSFLEGLSEHVWVLSPDLSLLKTVRRVRGTDWLLAELRAGTRWERLADEATALGIDVVGTAGVQLSDPSERKFQRLLHAVQRKRPFARVARWELASERGWLLDEGGMKAAFSRRPDALERAAEVARDCRCGASQDPVALAAGTASRPDAGQELRERVMASLGAHREGAATPEIVQRVDEELRVLGRGARPESLLLLADAAAELRTGGRLVLPDAGLASSLVAWALELTPANPMELGLSSARLCCDGTEGRLRLDLGVAAAAKSAVVRAFEQRLGPECVGRPAQFVRWTLREAVRDIARSASLRPSECERVLRQLPGDWRGEGPDELLARCPRLVGAGLDEDPWRGILRSAARLAGVPRTIEMGEGVLVSGRPLVERVASEHRRGGLVTQWDRQGASAMGLLTLELAERRSSSLVLHAGGERGVSDVRAMLARGDSLGCPGLEAAPVRAALRRGLGTLPDVLTAMALEGGFVEERLEAAASLAALSSDEMERLRIGLAEGGPAERAWLRRRFVEGARSAGVPGAEAGLRWEALLRDVAEASSRAELVGTALGGMRCARLALERPHELLLSLIAAPGGQYPLWVHVAAAQRRGVVLLPPSVQEAGVGSSCPADGVLRVGLGVIHGVREELAALIVDSRQRSGRFHGLADFLERVPAGVDEVDSLVAAGALDDVDEALVRSQLRLVHRRLRWAGGTAVQGEVAGLDSEARKAAELRDELGALGYTLSGHPLHIVSAQLPDDVVHAAALSRCVGSRVRVGGWMAARELVGGLHRSWRCELDDGTALFEARFPDRLVTAPLAGPWCLAGEVREEGRRLEILVDEAHPLDLDGAEVGSGRVLPAGA
ncbi:MAG: PHP domain-containing protein [Deltaproteobacteria bacterium]|nr:PHP domain-containing protein [Deltaproteobacteria bacterium]